MTLVTSGYTVGSNLALNHARILWDAKFGAVTADGVNGDLAQNDYTAQKWVAGTGSKNWTVDLGAAVDLDTLCIAAHNLGSVGATVDISTSTDNSTYTSRGSVAPTDDSAIAFMFNAAGAAVSARYVRVALTGSAYEAKVGIIRMGKALQMQRPIFGGVNPLGLSQTVETQQAVSETGNWLGRTVQIVSQQTVCQWEHLTAAWYRSDFWPFAQTLPQKPFFLLQNPLRMPESVGWCWTDQRPVAENMGMRDLMSVSLNITGYMG